MKILLVNKFFYLKGGAEKYFFELDSLLKRKGHTTLHFSMAHNKNFFSENSDTFIKNVDYDKKGLMNKFYAAARLLYSFEARKAIRPLLRQNPDIVHLNNIYHQISPSIIDEIRGNSIPIVLNLHDLKIVCASYAMLSKGRICEACIDKSYYHCALNRCFKDDFFSSALVTLEMYLHHKFLKIYDHVHLFISPSKFLKHKIEQMGFQGKIVHLPNFINLETYHPDYNSSGKEILYFGRLSKDKGVGTLIAAMKPIKNYQLKIAGEGPMLEQLKKEADGCDHIHFLGYLDAKRLQAEIKRSMFTTITSELYENNPLSVIESFALGKPVVGSNIGGIPELVQNNKTGILYKAGDRHDLREKIVALIDDKKKIRYLGQNARKFVETHLNQEVYYDNISKVYAEAVGLQA
jgi:glycosyltransferase involved in cell wall biosynthesis